MVGDYKKMKIFLFKLLNSIEEAHYQIKKNKKVFLFNGFLIECNHKMINILERFNYKVGNKNECKNVELYVKINELVFNKKFILKKGKYKIFYDFYVPSEKEYQFKDDSYLVSLQKNADKLLEEIEKGENNESS